MQKYVYVKAVQSEPERDFLEFLWFKKADLAIEYASRYDDYERTSDPITEKEMYEECGVGELRYSQRLHYVLFRQCGGIIFTLYEIVDE